MKSLIRTLRLSLLVLILATVAAVMSTKGTATAATSSTINFQARLQTAAGAIVQDGNYNVEFKIYNASSSSGSSQGSCTGDAACLWTETRTGANVVRVTDGYLTVNLGSVTAFPSTMPWDQQLWLTMNIGGTGGTPSWDGEMNPRIQLTAIPYAFKANAAFNIQNASYTTLLSTSGNQVTLPSATGSSSALVFGGDSGADIYKSGTGTLKMDGELQVANGVDTFAASGGLVIRNYLIAGDAQPSFRIVGSGQLAWGAGGSSGVDTLLYRSGTTALYTNSSLQVAGNLTTTSSIGFTNTGNANQSITLNMIVTSAVNAHDVVVIDTANAGQVTTTGQAGNNKVFGVATTTNSAGVAQAIAVSGIYQVNADTPAVNVGDYLVTSSTAGLVEPSTSPSSGQVIGRALSSKSSGSTGLVWIYLTSGQSGGGSGSGSSGTTSLYESNVQTDTTRAAANQTGGQGDGLTPLDSSTGSWEGTTNLVVNGGLEGGLSGGYNGWNANGSGATVAQSTTISKFGSASLKVTTDGTTGYRGSSYIQNSNITAGNKYTVSVWVYSPSDTTPMQLNVYRKTAVGGSVTGQSWTSFNLTNQWQHVTLTFTAEASTTDAEIEIRTNSTQPANTFYVDGLQVEQKGLATPYVETSGSTASRTASKVLAPSSLVSASQGWMAFRLRPEWSSSSPPYSYTPAFVWGDDGNNTLQLIFLGSGYWELQRATGGTYGSSATQASTFTAGQPVTVVAAWTSTQLKVSVNGGAFTAVSNSNVPTLASTLISIGGRGSNPGIDGYNLNGEVLWAASGTGTLSDNDAATLYEYGSTDPSLGNLQSLNSGVSGATMSWDGESTYINQGGGSGLAGTGSIQNGTVSQQANFNIQSVNSASVTAIIQGATSQSADILEVKDSSNTNLLAVDASGNLSVKGNIGFSGIGNTNQGITLNEVVTSAVNAGDVVVIDTANAGQVTASTTANSTQVFGIATQTKSAGQSQPIIISGIYQVNVTGTVAIGDYLVTSSTTGQAQSNSSPTGGVVGQAMSTASGGKAWVRISPATGAGGGSGGGMTKLYDVTLGANSANFDVTNIPGGYDNLKVVAYLRDTTAATSATIPGLRFNNDSTANYDRSYVAGQSTTYVGGDEYGQSGFRLNVAAASSPSTYYTPVSIEIPNYTNTTGFKSFTGTWAELRGNVAGSQILYSGSGLYHGTSAISRITLVANTTFAAGSRLVIYGVGGSGGGGGGQDISARVYNSASEAVATSSPTTMTFDSERYDTDGLHSTSANTQRLTAPVAGKYLITGNIEFQNSTGGSRVLGIAVNGAGTPVAEQRTAPVAGDPVDLSVSTVYSLNAGDYVTLVATQNSGSTISVVAGGSQQSPEFSMALLTGGITQGGTGIANGTATQVANFNIQSASASSVTAVIQGATSQSADILEVKDSSNANLLAVDASGNLSVKGNIGFSGIGNTNQGITLNENITGSVTAGDVVVIDTANAGYVTDSTTANSTKVFGIATKTQTGGSEPIVISGIYQINVTGSVNIGDYLVTSSTTGKAQSSSSPSGGVVGQAMATDSSGTVWARISPASGAGGGSGSSSDYGLMESDFTSAGTIGATAYSGASTITIGNNIYMFGGYTGSLGSGTGTSSEVMVAPVNNPTNWTTYSNKLPGPLSLSSVAVIGSYVYLFGGYTGSGFSQAIYRAPVSDPINSWTNLGNLLYEPIEASSLVIIGSNIYLFGGNNGGSLTSKIYTASIGNPTSWSLASGSLPTAMDVSSPAVIGNYVYLFGGWTGSAATQHIYRASISNPAGVGSWSDLGALLPAGSDYGNLAIIGNYIYLLGYASGSSTPQSGLMRAAVTNPTYWTAVNNVTLPVPLANSSVAIAGSAVYLLGGATTSSSTNAIYSAPIVNGSPDVSSNPSWITDSNYSTGGGSGTSSQTSNTNSELAYATLPASVTNSTTNVYENVLTLPSITTDGNTPIYVQFVSGLLEPCNTSSNAGLFFGLFEGATQINQTFSDFHGWTNGDYSGYTSLNAIWPKFIPSAGSHTYSIKMESSNCAGSVISGGNYATAYARIYLANPSLQGGAGIQNGTTVQTANFNIQSASASSVTAVIQGATSQSADILEVKDSSSNNLLAVDASGNLSVKGSIGFSNTGNANQIMTVNEPVTTTVNQYDVVVIDTNNAGQVTTTTLANSTKVFGVATQTKSLTGQTEPIAISGIYKVNVDTAAVNIGDYLVTSGTAGLATDSTSPGGGVIGQAMSAKTAGSNGTVWVRLNPGNGSGGSGSGAAYGLMESDWTSAGTLPVTMYGSTTVTIGNNIYLFGGQTSGGGAWTTTIYSASVSNPTSWSPAGGSLPAACGVARAQIAIIGSYVYIFGGINSSGSLTKEICSAPTSTPTSWTDNGALLPVTLDDSSLAIIGSNVYLFGGYTGSGNTNAIYSASISTPTSWSATGGVIPASLSGSSVAVIRNYVYLFGGYTSSSVATIYRGSISNPGATAQWSTMAPPLAFGTYGAQLAIVGNYIYLMGGYASGGPTSNIQRAPLNNPLSWSNLSQGYSNAQTNIPSVLYYSQAAVVGNALYLFGGNNGSATNAIYSAPIFNGSPDLSSNPSWKVDSNVSSGGGSGTSSQTSAGNYELAYSEYSSNVTVNTTLESSANTIVSANSITSDGTTPITVNFFVPGADMGNVSSTKALIFVLYQDGSSIGQIAEVQGAQASAGTTIYSITGTRRLIPTAGSHTYVIKAYEAGGSWTVYGGAGGSGALMPGFIRITLANPSLQGGSAGILNGTTTQTANFNIQSANANNPTAVIQGATSQSADILDVKDGSGNIVFNVGPTGNVSLGTVSGTGRLKVQANNNAWGEIIQGGTTSGQSYGLAVSAGTSASDVALEVYNSTGATPYLFVRGDGNVGIGTSSPGMKLEVNSTVKVSAGGNSHIDIRGGSDGSSSSSIYLYNPSGTLATVIGDGTYASYIGGNLGVGTTAPKAQLQLGNTGTLMGTDTSGNGTVLGFNTYNSAGTYDALATGNRSGYLQIDNNGIALNYTTSTQTADTALSSVVNVLSVDTSGNITLGGNVNAGGKLLYNYNYNCASWPSDLNSATASGYMYGCGNGSPANAPGGGALNGFVYFVGSPGSVGVQYYYAYSGTQYHRTLWYGTWYGWTSP